MNKIGRPKIDRKEIAEKLKELEKSYNNKVITQEFCAEKLGITHRTFCNIIKSSFDFSIFLFVVLLFLFIICHFST